MSVQNSRGSKIRSVKTKIGMALVAFLVVASGIGAVFATFQLTGTAPITVTSTTTTTTTTITVNTTAAVTSAIITSMSIGGNPCTVGGDGLSALCTTFPLSVVYTQTDTATTTLGDGSSNGGSSVSGPIYLATILEVTIKNTGVQSLLPITVHASSSAIGVAVTSSDPSPSFIAPGASATYSWDVTATGGGPATITVSITG